jgi:hypothetical protein
MAAKRVILTDLTGADVAIDPDHIGLMQGVRVTNPEDTGGDLIDAVNVYGAGWVVVLRGTVREVDERVKFGDAPGKPDKPGKPGKP